MNVLMLYLENADEVEAAFKEYFYSSEWDIGNDDRTYDELFWGFMTIYVNKHFIGH